METDAAGLLEDALNGSSDGSIVPGSAVKGELLGILVEGSNEGAALMGDKVVGCSLGKNVGDFVNFLSNGALVEGNEEGKAPNMHTV